VNTSICLARSDRVSCRRTRQMSISCLRNNPTRSICCDVLSPPFIVGTVLIFFSGTKLTWGQIANSTKGTQRLLILLKLSRGSNPDYATSTTAYPGTCMRLVTHLKNIDMCADCTHAIRATFARVCISDPPYYSFSRTLGSSPSEGEATGLSDFEQTNSHAK